MFKGKWHIFILHTLPEIWFQVGETDSHSDLKIKVVACVWGGGVVLMGEVTRIGLHLQSPPVCYTLYVEMLFSVCNFTVSVQNLPVNCSQLFGERLSFFFLLPPPNK